jgi:hypothetical protein
MKALFAGLTLAVIFAAACGDDDDDGRADSDEAETQAEHPGDGRRQGGEITIAIGDDIDPHHGPSSIALDRMLWRGPYSLDKDNQYPGDYLPEAWG